MRAKELRRILRCHVASRLPGVLSRVPASWAYAFGSLVGYAAYWAIPRDRRRAHHNLSLVYPHLSERQVASMAKTGLIELGKNICDFVRHPKLSQDKREALVDIEGLDRLREATRNKRGAIIVTGHMGCWELIAGALNANGFHLRSIARPMKEPRLQNLLNQHRQGMGVDTIESTSPLPALRHLKTGGLLGVLIDQRVPRGVTVDFLGQQTLITDAAARIALAANVQLMPVTMTRNPYPGLDGSRHTMVIDEPIDPPRNRDDIQSVTQLAADALGKRILERPMQWMWIHPRWEDRRQTRAPGLDAAPKSAELETAV